jgi:high affinity sulfate transporter 1
MQLRRIKQWMPGLATLIHYDRKNIKYDIRAGLSVAAVALPVAIAYAELMGINAIIGLYACIIPMVVYAIFGTSRQLIVGPDAATCAVITATIAPLALGDQNTLWQLAIIMTLMTGFWCLIAGHFRLAIFTDFLSQPILQGLLNGVAVTIVVSQFGNILGIGSLSTDLIECLIALPGNMAATHGLTLTLAAICLASLFILNAWYPKLPAPLFVMSVATFLSWHLNFDTKGIAIIGSVDHGLPVIHMSSDFNLELLRELIIPSLNLAVISIVSFMMTVRSFSVKNGYEVDIDQELRALGYINIAAGISQGFAVSAATSRTAVNDANNGKTQMVSCVAALIIFLVLFFLTRFLSFIPLATLGAVLIYAAWSMFSLRSIFAERKHNRLAYILTLFTLLAVITVGLVDGIGFAILLGLLQFLHTVFRPTDQLLGVDGQNIIREITAGKPIKPLENMVIYRFNSTLTYFNVNYFKKRVLQTIDDSNNKANWLVIDATVCFTYNDASVFSVLNELIAELKIKGVTLVLAGRSDELAKWLGRNNIMYSDNTLILVPDLYFAIKMIQNNKLQVKIEEQEQAMASALPPTRAK